MRARDWAIFLDLDGTLLDLAASPESVFVPKHLVETLALLRRGLSGALAILSGRPLRTIDRLLHPLLLAAAGEHGAVLRCADGAIVETESETVVPAGWRAAIHEAAEEWPGVLVEEKSHGIAIHYRHNLPAALPIMTLLEALIAERDDFQVLPAVMARELRHRTVNKGKALTTLMAQQPFCGRRPLFIGDDVTDEDAIAAATHLGGLGLRVPEVFAGEPVRVRAWLAELAGTFDGTPDQMGE
ncbi:trehalose-phosphatase [Dongia mobilis]|jgi:trehalose 6-phosphate phosphatase|uniref:trehalose-phosphatase n=1 Tax=Dongia sp. TaxID=1977262 RepID=UPI0026EC898C